MVSRAALNCMAYNIFGNSVRVVFKPLLIIKNLNRLFVVELSVKQFLKMSLCLLLRKAGNFFEDLHLALLYLIAFGDSRVNLLGTRA